ncbi:MAG: hypothetical protein KGR98_08580 [Verrucomicrobia bacterium]|nr:hypothetical protein [Verrucomicrobiota bacterium]MDE3099625.1 hypothetical protein [Verrucomicrobiota bacterium]
MNENDDFEALKRLLALKRHEVPPPGYFDKFSSRVISRIRLREHRAENDPAAELFNRAPWLLRFLQLFEAKPAVAGTFAAVLCMVVAFGVVYAERPDSTPQPIFQAADSSPHLLAASEPAAGIAPVAMPAPDLFATGMSNGSPSGLEQLFGQGANAQPVNYTVPAH